MAWSFAKGVEMAWPASLERKSYAKADKGGQLAGIFTDLDAIVSEFKKITIPGTPVGRADLIATWEADVKKLTAGPLKKLAGSLQILGRRADAIDKAGVVDVKGKKVKLTAESSTAIKIIRTEANSHAASIAPNVIGPQLAALSDRLQATAKKAVLDRVGTTLKAFKDCAGKGHPGIAKAVALVRAWPADDPDAQQEVRMNAGRELAADSRDMTQNLVNIDKALKAGVDPAAMGLQPGDVVAMPKVSTILVRYGNNSNGVGSFVNGLSKDEMVKLVRTVDVQAKLFDQIAARLK